MLNVEDSSFIKEEPFSFEMIKNMLATFNKKPKPIRKDVSESL